MCSRFSVFRTSTSVLLQRFNRRFVMMYGQHRHTISEVSGMLTTNFSRIFILMANTEYSFRHSHEIETKIPNIVGLLLFAHSELGPKVTQPVSYGLVTFTPNVHRVLMQIHSVDGFLLYSHSTSTR